MLCSEVMSGRALGEARAVSECILTLAQLVLHIRWFLAPKSSPSSTGVTHGPFTFIPSAKTTQRMSESWLASRTEKAGYPEQCLLPLQSLP